MKHCRLTSTGALIVAAALAAGCGQDVQVDVQVQSRVSGWTEAKFEETQTNAVAHVSGKALHVETANGGINVRKQERADVEIISHIKATTEERLKAVTIEISRLQDQTLNVSVRWPDGKREGSESCSFELLMPDLEGLTLRSSNGKLKAGGFRGKAQLRTSNGSIELSDHRGEVELRSSNGSVDARDVLGPVKAETSNGRIKVRLASEAPGPVQLESSNGKITLEVGSSFGGELDISTSNGGIDTGGLKNARLINSDRRNVKLQIGDSEHRSRIKTSNGSIQVKAR